MSTEVIGSDLDTWEPNEMDRHAVKLMISTGMKHGDICQVICPFGPLAPRLFRQLFRDEIKVGRIKLNADVTRKAYEMAVSGKWPTMTIFWLKCHADWNDKAASDKGTVTEKDLVKELRKTATTMVETLPGLKVESSG